MTEHGKDVVQMKGGERFYPVISKAYQKWMRHAGENPIIMANVGFETYLAGWQEALAALPQRDDSGLVEGLAGALKMVSGFNWRNNRTHLLEIVNAAIAKAADAKLVDGWQPIETAPRDGTPLDLWVPNKGRISDATWWKNHKVWLVGKDVYKADSPTHWMPAPKPPAAPAKAGV